MDDRRVQRVNDEGLQRRAKRSSCRRDRKENGRNEWLALTSVF